MRPIYAVLAGLAAVAATGIGAFANEPNTTVHEAIIEPGGGFEFPHKIGVADIAVVTVRTPPPMSESPLSPFNDPFVAYFGDMADEMARISNEMYQMRAVMDRRMEMMMREADEMARLNASGADTLVEASASPTAGDVSYTYVSTTSGSGTCARVVEVTTDAKGKRHVASKTSGDCSGTSLSAPVLDRAEPTPGVLSISASRGDGALIPAIYRR